MGLISLRSLCRCERMCHATTKRTQPHIFVTDSIDFNGGAMGYLTRRQKVVRGRMVQNACLFCTSLSGCRGFTSSFLYSLTGMPVMALNWFDRCWTLL
jgi:hypothetical protein